MPQYDDVKAGLAAQPLSASSPIVLWAFLFGARIDDVVSINFDGPEGSLFESDDVLSRNQALVFRAGGLNAPDEGWAAGTYTGTVIHSRDDVELDRQTITTTLQ